MKRIALALSLLTASAAYAQVPDAGALDAGSGSAVDTTTTVTVETKPHDAVSDPLEHPVQAWDEAKAARKGGWAMLVFFCLVGLTKALAYGRDKLQGMPGLGWLAARLAVGKTAMIVAGVGAVGAAGYDAVVGGGSVTSALFAAGAAAAGALHSTTVPKVGA